MYYNNAINVRQRDWDQLKYFLTGMAIKEFIFFECLYFSEYDIQILFFGPNFVTYFLCTDSAKYTENHSQQEKCHCFLSS